MSKLIVICENAEKELNNKFRYLIEEVIGVSPNDYKLLEFQGMIDPDKVTKKQKEVFLLSVQEFVDEFEAKCILSLGSAACKILNGQLLTVKNRGTIQQAKGLEDVYFIPTYDSDYINSKRNAINSWAKDALKAYNVANDIMDEQLPTTMVYCDTEDKIKDMVSKVKETGMAYFDFETPKIDKDKATFKEGHHGTVLSISFQMGSGYVIPLEHKDSCFSKMEVLDIMEYLKEHIFENPSIRKAAHNLNYDAHMLRIYGVGLRGRLDDTQLMHHLYDETERHGLKELVNTYFPEFAGYEEAMKGFNWVDIPIRMLSQYCAVDTDLGLRLLVALESWLLEDENIYKIYRNITMPAFKTLFSAESEGMSINRPFLKKSIAEVQKLIRRQKQRLDNHQIVAKFLLHKAEKLKAQTLEDLESKLHTRVCDSITMAKKASKAKWAKEFNNKVTTGLTAEQLEACAAYNYKKTATEDTLRTKINEIKMGVVSTYEGINYKSPPQLTELLYTSTRGFGFRNAGGTGEDILKDLKDTTGFIDNLLSYRKLNKTLSTYLVGIENRLDNNDRVHTSFKLHGTVSGRLSSANPNLQNMPNTAKLRDEDLIHAVGLVKKSFNVPEGYTLYQYDYGQAELRTIAWFAGEQTMLDVYARGEDLHAKTASEMMEVTLQEFYKLDKSEQKRGRSNAKAVNFGLIYGMEAAGFQEYAKNQYGLVLTLEESKKIRNTFFRTYPKLLEYHDKYIAKAKKFGWVRTFYGRRRRTPDIHNQDSYIASMDERAAINSPIQGTSGEFMVFSLGLLQHRLNPRVKIINTIHDSVMAYIPDDLQEETTAMVRKTMENLPNELYFGKKMEGVSMVVDAERSKESWKDLEEI